MNYIIMFLAALSLFVSGPAQAAIFTDVVSFHGAVQPTLNYEYQDVGDNEHFSWSHSVLSHLNGHSLSEIVILDAALDLTYAKTEGNEIWSLSGLSGTLGKTEETPMITSFIFGSLALADLAADGIWNAVLLEATTGVDRIRLVESRLTGNYSVKEALKDPPPGAGAVPEMSSFLMLVFSISGFAGKKLLRR